MNTIASICCTTFNHAPFIRDALDGFLMQITNFPFEVIIHDDASTDGTSDIIREYEKRYPNVIRPIYQTENQYSKGIKISATYVWPNARGKYIALCEGDDYWTDPLKLQKQVDFLEANSEYVVCHHDASIVDEHGTTIAESKLPDAIKRDSSGDELIRRPWMLTLTVCFRNVLGEMPPELYKVFNGDTFLFSMLGNFGGSHYMGREIRSAAYRRHAGGVWSTLSNDEANVHAANTYYWLGRYYWRLGKKEYSRHFAEEYQGTLLKLVGTHDVKYSLKACREFLSRRENLVDIRFAFHFVFHFAKARARNSYLKMRRIIKSL
jgi:glycosyltransferase involved in cell wall biosynthesis